MSVSGFRLKWNNSEEVVVKYAQNLLDANGNVITLTSPINFLGVSSTVITDGGNQTPTIGGVQVTPENGNIVIYDSKEFIYSTTWHELGDTSAYILKPVSTLGSATKPVYYDGTGLAEGSTYAGGTKLTLNGVDKGADSAGIYAPTTAGTANNVLISNGSGEPSWTDTLNIKAITLSATSGTPSLAIIAGTDLNSNGTFYHLGEIINKVGATQYTLTLPSVTGTLMVNPMTAVGDVIVGGASGAPTRLAKGSAGQVLKVNSAGTGLEWGTDNAGMSNPMTTAGDIIYGGSSGTPTRLAKGTSGQMLVMNSGATAPEWTTLLISAESFTINPS